MTDEFHYQGGELHCEGVRVAELCERHGTPLYVYSEAGVARRLRALREAFAEADPLICYSVKANGNLGLLRVVLAESGAFDVVSWGEFRRVLEIGGDPGRVVFAGVGKTDEEIEAALHAGLLMFNVESEEELEAIARVAARLGKSAPVALRVNPDVDPKTHRYISTGKKESKFGMDIERALRAAESAAGRPELAMIGMHMHIGSQITTTEPYAVAARRGVEVVAAMRGMGHPMSWWNMGGGFGISYRGDEGPSAAQFAAAVLPAIRESGCRLALEPGRSVVGNAGVLLARVIFTKRSGEKHFVIADAAMNDLIRPALYQGYHKIWPVRADGPPPDEGASPEGTLPSDVVGPVCESGDFLAQDRPLPTTAMARGDLLAVFSAGAYGMAMASNYNARPRAAEVLVSGTSARLIRRRETIEELMAPELI